MPKKLPTLGFIGLGNMGMPMCETLLSAGCSLTAYDIDSRKADTIAEKGAIPSASFAATIMTSEVICTSLPSSAVFVEVAEQGLLPNAEKGQIFIDLGTTEPQQTRRLAKEFKKRGASLLDSPVSGGPGGCASGTLHIFAGGEKGIFRKCLPILNILGNPEHVVYCGKSGTGQIVKGVNQLGMGLLSAAMLEAVSYGVNGGADIEAIVKGVGGTDGFRKFITEIGTAALENRAENVLVKYPELPYFLGEADKQAFDIPMTKAFFEFCDKGERAWKDNMGRPYVSFWHMLMKK